MKAYKVLRFIGGLYAILALIAAPLYLLLGSGMVGLDFTERLLYVALPILLSGITTWALFGTIATIAEALVEGPNRDEDDYESYLNKLERRREAL